MVKYFLLLVLLIPFAASAQEFKVKASTDTTDYLVGDYIKLTYHIEHAKGIQFAEPAFRDSIKNIDIISVGKPQTKEENNTVITDYLITLSRYDSAEVRIPPLTFYYWHGKPGERAPFLQNYDPSKDSTLKAAQSNEVVIKISTVKVNVQEDIKDIKAPVKMSPAWWLILLYILGFLLLGAAVVYIYLRIQKKKRAAAGIVEIKIPPDEAALKALHELEVKSLWQQGKVKEFHSEVTGIIRKYFEERFGFPALELTSGETMELLGRRPDAKQILAETADFLEKADLVKFAKFIPMNDVNELMLKRAYEIVEQTKTAVISEEGINDVQ